MSRATIDVIGKFHEDDRAQRLIDIFPFWPNDQLNLSYINSTEHVVAWHAHEKQADYWICIKGSLKVGIAEPRVDVDLKVPRTDDYDFANNYDTRFEYLSDKNFGVLRIPPGVYHGYRALEPNSILLYFLTRKYDPDDEFRALIGTFGEDWDVANK